MNLLLTITLLFAVFAATKAFDDFPKIWNRNAAEIEREGLELSCKTYLGRVKKENKYEYGVITYGYFRKAYVFFYDIVDIVKAPENFEYLVDINKCLEYKRLQYGSPIPENVLTIDGEKVVIGFDGPRVIVRMHPSQELSYFDVTKSRKWMNEYYVLVAKQNCQPRGAQVVRINDGAFQNTYIKSNTGTTFISKTEGEDNRNTVIVG